MSSSFDFNHQSLYLHVCQLTVCTKFHLYGFANLQYMKNLRINVHTYSKYWSSRVRRKLNYVFWLLHRKRLFIFTRIFNTTERKYSLNEGVRINDKGKECLAFNFDPKETKSFDKVPGPTGIHAIPFVGTTLHFKPFGKTISISVWYLSRLNHPSFKRQRTFDIQCNAGFFSRHHSLNIISSGNTKPRGPNDILRMFQQQYGDLFRFRFAFRWIMVVSNPDLAKEVLSIRVKYPFRPDVDIVKVFCIRNNQEEGLGTLYDFFVQYYCLVLLTAIKWPNYSDTA